MVSEQERAGTAPRSWAFWPFRLLVSLAAVLIFVQSVLAGQFLSGTYGSLLWHQNNAALADMVMIATIAAGVLMKWPGRGPLWPTLAVAGLLGLSYAQSEFGFARVLTVHVPLGVAMVVLAGLLAAWVWRHPHSGKPADEVTINGGDAS